MGLFSFFSSSSRSVSTDKLPKSADALRKLYYRAHRNEQYDAVVTILEKLDSLNALSKDDCKTLSQLYVAGCGCAQDLDKARELMYRSISGAPSLRELPELLFLECVYGASRERYYYPDYDRILSRLARYISHSQPYDSHDHSRYKYDAIRFYLLRDLVYLLELGLKDVRDEDGLRAFVSAHPSDWAVRFYDAYLFTIPPGYYVTRESFADFMNEDSLVALYQLDVIAGSTHGSTPAEHRRCAEENKRCYSKCLQRYEYPAQGVEELTRAFCLKYSAPMTEQEVLDAVYAEAAAMVAATRAAEEAQRQAEARQKEEEERKYQLALSCRSGRLSLAEHCLFGNDLKDAEVHLLAALALPSVTDEDADAGIAIWGALTRVYHYQKDLNRALQCAVTFFDRYHERFPEDQTWAKYRPDVLKMVPYALCDTFYHYQNGPQHKTWHTANDYVSSAAEVFSDAYCTALRPLAAGGDWDACMNLALHLLNKSDSNKQYDGSFWLKRSAAAGHIPSMYFAAAEYPHWLGLSPDKKRKYLMYVAASDNAEYANMAKMVISTEDLRAAKDKAFKQSVQEFVQTQRQASIDAKMDEYRGKLDLMERDLHLAFSGSGSTIEERILSDEFSSMDALRLRELREEVEARAREKFSKG